jgi:5'-nucleotidase
LGLDIVYSGTVAAAREACSLGFPAVAISQYMRRDVPRDWSSTGRRAVFVLEKLLERSDFAPGFWNVNLPVLLPEQHELSFPITECQPEKQPLAFDFQMSPQEEVEGMATNYRMHAGDTTAASGSSHVIYKSNYQLRPRQKGSDVDLCFEGHATCSRLRIGDFLAM